MSCFSGCFTSLPGVRCDRFDSLTDGGHGGSITEAGQFFLSHCHSDHMVGLDTLSSLFRKKSFKNSRSQKKLYCSLTSKAFVLSKYPDIPENAVACLIPNQPQTLAVLDRCEIYNLRVTGLPANHCPGSLMFMFERLDNEGTVCKRILYTGDFRFDNPRVPLTALQALHRGSSPLRIDEMYLDTTFCSSKYLSFPSRRLAEERIWQICEKWIKKNGVFKDTHSKHVVLFQLPARYGYESILHHIYQKSSYEWRVHVPETKFSEYLCNSSLADCTDPDPNLAHFIHACTTNYFQKKSSVLLPCKPGHVSVCHIKPSAMYFSQDRMATLEDSLVSVSPEGNSYRVCYSTHSSLAELEIFVRHFSPLQITPCAIPPHSSREEVRNILASFLQPSQLTEADSNSTPIPPITLSPHQPRPAAAPADQARYDPDVWSSPSHPEQIKRKLEDGEGEDQENLVKVARVHREDSLGKICFNDTLDLDAHAIYEEAVSSDEEPERLIADTKAPHAFQMKNAANESFSLVLEPSDDESVFDSCSDRDVSLEILEDRSAVGNYANADTEKDTPEIEDLLEEAEENGLPDYVIKTMMEVKRRKNEVVLID